LIITIPFWCGIRGNISEGISSDRDSTLFNKNFENMTRSIMLVAFGPAERDKGGNGRSLYRGDFLQPIDNIGRCIIIKNRSANDYKIVIG